ncbi:hypothetical protein ABOM_010094 [Aspergillus bombycis]|uniref:BZIP domain-containing protein n=1 Tax=Aspergillus bombycis TaxID=109264 RepID=A0A1F7ZPT9_9EURO|nr:hypothetical protein ABOM_010094 [Aspergillus bombycis]OGM41447.1 hypothetical protein ABOM_010094 [Aspergillus bombycis]
MDDIKLPSPRSPLKVKVSTQARQSTTNQPTRIVNYEQTEAFKALLTAMSTADGESSRNRGRPRQVPTAAPDTVRRTQLREAQRAYRSRQQLLLASLKSRVARLEDAFGQLAQIMDSFDNQVIKPGAQMSHAQLFQAVKLFQNEICFQLERTDSRVLPNEGKKRSSATQSQRPQQSSSDRPSSSGPCQVDKENISVPTWTKEKAFSSDFWRRFLGSSNGFLPPVASTAHEPNACIRVTSSIDREDHAIEYTASTFTERLYRTCAENGHRLVCNDTLTDEEMQPQFGLLLQTVPREQIRLYFEKVLGMESCNPVRDRRFPFISLGGAGTHFPSARQDSRSQNLHRFRETNGVLEIPSDEEWFDISDMEGFLMEQGIKTEECYGAFVTSSSRTNSNPSTRPGLLLPSGDIIGSSDLNIPSQTTSSNVVMVLDETTIIDIGSVSVLVALLGFVALMLRPLYGSMLVGNQFNLGITQMNAEQAFYVQN